MFGVSEFCSQNSDFPSQRQICATFRSSEMSRLSPPAAPQQEGAQDIRRGVLTRLLQLNLSRKGMARSIATSYSASCQIEGARKNIRILCRSQGGRIRMNPAATWPGTSSNMRPLAASGALRIRKATGSGTCGMAATHETSIGNRRTDTKASHQS